MLVSLQCHAQIKVPALVPTPASVKMGQGSFIFSARTVIRADAAECKTVNFFTKYLLNTWKFKTMVVSSNVKNVTRQPAVYITTKGSEQLPAGGYKLSITPAAITLVGKDAGLFYGIQTLIQLFPLNTQGTVVLPCLNITDQPRFAYRGLMLDVSRHFFTVGQIKDLLDLMAYYKLNRFHWHLTDDQGWRLEIKSLPKLTQVGAWRVPRLEFSGNTLPPQPGESASDGGFYTQEQVKDIIRYATERHIEILPEIDVPGHSMAAIAGYPELCVTQNPDIKVNPGSSFAKWFPHGGFEMYVDNTINPTDEHVYQFLDKVFTEVAALFPYPYIHIGGDECYKGFWEKDAGVQRFIKQHHIKDMHALQGYFISRLNKIVQSKGKKLIGWDEILEGNLNDNVAVMNRFGEKGAVEQARKGLDIVLAPGGNGLYFDYAQSKSDMEPSSHGGNAPLWQSFNYNPEYPGLSTEEKKHILGVEACVWTEHISTIAKLYYMILPRMLGLAETSWSLQANKSYKQFITDFLPAHLLRFDKADINYRVPTALEQIDTTINASTYKFVAKVPFKGAKVYYTLNNITPTETDHEYIQPVTLTIPENTKMILKTIVITPVGHRSVVTRMIIDNKVK
ncbi:beta-N-acetylhexosaminidase [Mucilaginibacter boryungensis]|uniref:beta-N-acetylhexosaminidase n=1 Tax=Mucilaginibacter boryungensis TaxID=768480 RepID=A0ABR9XE06_9SPHI|nr:family 20 glycosylhydrolase [Mucilaginibacter boryungensis]MBE9665405.1 family 20 glycosylhydrolase [Mucilaginibacter boryungensis]